MYSIYKLFDAKKVESNMLWFTLAKLKGNQSPKLVPPQSATSIKTRQTNNPETLDSSRPQVHAFFTP